MNKKRYNEIRRLIHENGRYHAFKWLGEKELQPMVRLAEIQDGTDPIAERAEIIQWCKREGRHLTPRHTASRELIKRLYQRKEQISPV